MAEKLVWVLTQKQRSKGVFNSRGDHWRGKKYMPVFSKAVANGEHFNTKDEAEALKVKILDDINKDMVHNQEQLNAIQHVPTTYKNQAELDGIIKVAQNTIGYYSAGWGVNTFKEKVDHWLLNVKAVKDGLIEKQALLVQELDFCTNKLFVNQVVYDIHFRLAGKIKLSWEKQAYDRNCVSCGGILPSDTEMLRIPNSGTICIFCMEKYASEAQKKIEAFDQDMKDLRDAWERCRFMQGLD